MRTAAKAIMVVELSVDPARRTEFEVFYHNDYIPQFLAAVPLVVSARRYSQMDGGPADPAAKRFFTIYELGSDDCMGKIDAAIARSAHKSASDRFKVWKEDGLTSFARCYYHEVARAEGDSWPWNSGYLCIFNWSIRRDVSGDDALKLVGDYVQAVMKQSPRLLVASRTYSKDGSENREFMTVVEVSHPKGLLKFDPAFGEFMAAVLSNHEMVATESFYFYSV